MINSLPITYFYNLKSMFADDLFAPLATPNPCPLDQILLTQCALLLDIDGTLAGFQLDPKTSMIAPATLACLQAIMSHGVPVCLVTGRSVREAQAMAQPLSLPIAGTHGLEIFCPTLPQDLNQSCLNQSCLNQSNLSQSLCPATLQAIRQAVEQACATYPSLLIEHKPYSVAVHCRACPHLADTADKLMHDVAEPFADWTIKTGKYVWEILPKGVNKGYGIEQLLAVFASQGAAVTCPIFIGDDVTDEAGFAVVNRLGGISIKVGDGDTQAQFRLSDIDAVAVWLHQFLQRLQHL